MGSRDSIFQAPPWQERTRVLEEHKSVSHASRIPLLTVDTLRLPEPPRAAFEQRALPVFRSPTTNSAEQFVPHVSDSSSLLGNAHLPTRATGIFNSQN